MNIFGWKSRHRARPVLSRGWVTGWPVEERVLDNAARPSGALVFDPGEKGATLSPDQFDRLQAEMSGLARICMSCANC